MTRAAAVAAVIALASGCNKRLERQLDRARAAEAAIQLDVIARSATQYQARTGGFPDGWVGQTPATPCCAQPGQQCAPSRDAWSHPVWQALGFHIDQPHRFRYAYSGTATEFSAHAVGDLSCNGEATLFSVSGTIDHGTVRITKDTP